MNKKKLNELNRNHYYNYTTPPPAQGLQAGQVVAHFESIDRHHWQDHGSLGQPVLRARHHHLYLRRHGHAAVRAQLRGGQIRRRSGARLEFHRLPALLHDRFQSAVWRVD